MSAQSQQSKVNQTISSMTVRNSLTVSGAVNATLGSTSSPTISLTQAPGSLTDAAETLTATQLKAQLLVCTPTAARTKTLPSAASLVATLTSVGSSLDFYVINLGADTFHITIAVPGSGSTVGYMVVRDSDATAAADSGSAKFRLRMTNVTSGTEAYIVYRLC